MSNTSKSTKSGTPVETPVVETPVAELVGDETMAEAEQILAAQTPTTDEAAEGQAAEDALLNGDTQTADETETDETEEVDEVQAAVQAILAAREAKKAPKAEVPETPTEVDPDAESDEDRAIREAREALEKAEEAKRNKAHNEWLAATAEDYDLYLEIRNPVATEMSEAVVELAAAQAKVDGIQRRLDIIDLTNPRAVDPTAPTPTPAAAPKAAKGTARVSDGENAPTMTGTGRGKYSSKVLFKVNAAQAAALKGNNLGIEVGPVANNEAMASFVINKRGRHVRWPSNTLIKLALGTTYSDLNKIHEVIEQEPRG